MADTAMKKINLVAVVGILAWLGASMAIADAQTPEIRVGIIGTDTSHAAAFTNYSMTGANPNHVPGARVVAAFKGGSPDVDASRTRIDRVRRRAQRQVGDRVRQRR